MASWTTYRLSMVLVAAAAAGYGGAIRAVARAQSAAPSAPPATNR